MFAAGAQKLCEQQADAHDLRPLEDARDFAQWNVRRDERDREFSACQTHREIFYAAALREKFRLPRKPESDFVHSSFVNRSGHDAI
jgi:GAF domain-containing protein